MGKRGEKEKGEGEGARTAMFSSRSLTTGRNAGFSRSSVDVVVFKVGSSAWLVRRRLSVLIDRGRYTH